MLGKWPAILSASGWGSKVVLEAKNVRTAWGRGGGGLVKTSPDATATEEAETGPLAWPPFFPLAGAAAAWAYVGVAFEVMVVGGRQSGSR